MNQSLPVLKDLARVFPDIEDQLCSRHSILLGKLRNTYGKIYDHMDPSHYIVIKGVLDIFQEQDVSLSMALENGIILLSRQIDLGESIYINSNHFDAQLIFSADGKLEEGLNEYVYDITTAIQAANQDLSPGQLHGGIFYLHSNIVQSCFKYDKIMLISIFIAVSLINHTLEKLSLEQLIVKMAKHKIFGDQHFLRGLFGFKNRQFSLSVGQEQFKVGLQKQNKLVLCQLDLAKMDIKYEKNRKSQLLQRKRQILKDLSLRYNISSFLELFQREDQIQLSFPEEIENEDDPIMNTEKYPLPYLSFLSVIMKELGLLSQFNNGNITFQQLVSAQWELNSRYWKLHTEEVVELVEQIKDALKLNSCMITHQAYALIVTDKSKYTELLVFLRQKLHKGELKSKSLFKIEEELIQHRWSSDKRIGQKMFTSVPSEGVAVFDPSDAIWFD